MKIGTCISKPGTLTTGKLIVAHLEDGTPLEVPVKIAQGAKAGPTCFISCGMHGNELNGIELQHRFLRAFERENRLASLRGAIIFLPILNVSGFHHHRRRVFYDKHDLNRSFGVGEDSETVSYQIANTILREVVKRCDFGMDLHDSGRKNVLLPHTRVHQNDAVGTQALGGIFGTDIILVREGMPGMLADAAMKAHGIPVVTVEIGGAMILWDELLNRGIQGIKNILIHENMIDGEVVLPERQFFLRDRLGYKAPGGGIARVFWHLGDTVKAGDVLAEVYNPITGKLTEVTSDYCGIVFSRRMQARIKKNEELLAVMEFETCEHFPKGRARSVVETRTYGEEKGRQRTKPLYKGKPK